MTSLPTLNANGTPVRAEQEPAAARAGAKVGWKIGELAKQSGKSTRALRLYEELGLLVPQSRSAGGFRLYAHDALERVRWIGQLQALGFTLQDIQEAVQATAGEPLPREAMSRVRKLFTDKLGEVAGQIRELRELQREIADALAYLESCPSCSIDGSQDTQVSTAACSTCEEHGDEKAPSLIKGLTETAANAIYAQDVTASSAKPRG